MALSLYCYVSRTGKAFKGHVLLLQWQQQALRRLLLALLRLLPALLRLLPATAAPSRANCSASPSSCYCCAFKGKLLWKRKAPSSANPCASFAIKRTSPGRLVRSTSTASPSCLRSSATPSSPFRLVLLLQGQQQARRRSSAALCFFFQAQALCFFCNGNNKHGF